MPFPKLKMNGLAAFAAGAFCLGVFYVLFDWALAARVSPKLVTVLMWGMFVVPGLAVGSVARTSPIVLSAIVGMLGVLILAPPVDHLSFSVVLRMAPVAAFAVIVCSVSAILGRYAARKIRGADMKR